MERSRLDYRSKLLYISCLNIYDKNPFNKGNWRVCLKDERKVLKAQCA